MKFLVLDAGSSFLKAAVADSESLQLSRVCRSPALQRLPLADPLTHEIDAAEMVTAAKRLLAPLLREHPMAGLLITGQMGGLVFVDDHGQPQSNYISWQDQRTLPSSWPKLTAQLGAQVASVLGNEWKPGLTLPLLCHLRQQQMCPPGIACGLPDFLVAALTESRPAVERTSATGNLSVQTGQVADEVLAALDLSPHECPALVAFSDLRGHATLEGRSIRVYGGTGDHQTALVGALLQPAELSINVATGSQMSMLVEQPEQPHTRGQLRPFFDEHWLATVTNIPAGRALTAVLKLLTELSAESLQETHWHRFLSAAETVPDTSTEAHLGFFSGAVAGPGSFSGLTEDTLDVAHIARACLQAMARQYQQLRSQLAAGTPQKIVFSGGLARRSSLLRRLICEHQAADGRAMPARLAVKEDTLLGLAILGKVIGGQCESVREAIEISRQQLPEAS